MSLVEKNIIADNSIDWKDLGNGVRRKVMFYDKKMMLVKFEFKKDAVGALHNHPHLQLSYVASGVFEFNLGGEKKIIREGDVYNVPSGIQHGIICLEAGTLIDVFNPIRQDFLEN
ncbi:MAG: cupin domain-containing protein [Spirosomaceae bacterium]|nr:cupin domain-containing protein [Spirosomataceae bacterium]